MILKATITDVEANTAVASISFVVEEEQRHDYYILGYKDGTFRPEREVSRVELAAMLSRNLYKEDPGIRGSNYKDVPKSHWVNKYVELMTHEVIMLGDGSGEFRPEDSVTRAEFATTIARYLKLKMVDNPKRFMDTKKHWANEEVSAVVEAGLMEGNSFGFFRPDKTITRAEAVKVINKMLDRGPLIDVPHPTWSDVDASHPDFGEIEEASRGHKSDVYGPRKEKWIKNTNFKSW